MDSGSANALLRNKSNATNHYTLGPSTFGISASSDMNNSETWASGGGATATNPGTYYPLAGVGQTTYTNSNMGGNQSFPGFEVDMENVGR